MFSSIKVSAISLKPIKWDKSANADKMEMLFLEAAKDNPQLILTTEGVLEGYVVMDVVQKLQTAEEMLAISESIDGPYIQRMLVPPQHVPGCGLDREHAVRIGLQEHDSVMHEWSRVSAAVL